MKPLISKQLRREIKHIPLKKWVVLPIMIIIVVIEWNLEELSGLVHDIHTAMSKWSRL